MKIVLLILINIIAISIFAQKEESVYYDNGTVLNYKIKENNPDYFPNICVEFGGSMGRLLYSPLAFNMETGLKMKFRSYGLHAAYTQLLIKELMEDVLYASNSNNKINNYFEFKTGFDLDIWSGLQYKSSKITLKTTQVGNTQIIYRVSQDSVKRKNSITFHSGYLTHTGAISNGMRKNQSYYLTDVNGFALVQNRPDIVDAPAYDQRECVNFHTNLRAHHLYFGLSYNLKEHIVSKYKSNRSNQLKTGGRSFEWSVYTHFLYNFLNKIEPLKLNENVYIYSPVNERLLYILPSGEYNVEHGGEGGFIFSPFGWKIGTYLHFSNEIHPAIPASKSFIEMGVLPGLKNHLSLGAETDMGRFYFKIGVMLSIGLNTDKLKVKRPS